VRGILRGKIHRVVAVWPAVTQALSSVPVEQRLCDLQEVTGPGAAGQAACCEIHVSRPVPAGEWQRQRSWRFRRPGNCPAPAGTRSRSPRRANGCGARCSATQSHPCAFRKAAPIARLPGIRPRAGFEVLDGAPAHSLMLAGRHRFAQYRLTFDLAAATTHILRSVRRLSLAPA
jgi:hypothetical protein